MLYTSSHLDFNIQLKINNESLELDDLYLCNQIENVEPMNLGDIIKTQLDLGLCIDSRI